MITAKGIRNASLLTALLLVAPLLAGCLSDDAPPDDDAVERGGTDDGVLHVDIVAMACPDGYDNGYDDDVCLAYNGQLPGPTWVFQQGEEVTLMLHHKVAETLEAMDVDAALAAELGEARYTMHRHGVAQDTCSDGVRQLAGTEVCDSSVGPGETATYTFNTSFAGFWHYHDHGHTFNVEPEDGGSNSHTGSHRGLWGAFRVLPEGEETDHVLDAHLVNTGVNGGLGFEEQVTEGDRFDLIVTGLGYFDWYWEVDLLDPDGDVVDEILVGPGISRGFAVADARAGTYTWHAQLAETFETYRGLLDGAPMLGERPGPQQGTIEVLEGPEDGSGEVLPTRPGGSPVVEGDRTYHISFDFFSTQADGLPLLEAYAGELTQFQVAVTTGFAHAFHMHGHTWEHPKTGQFIDAQPLVPGTGDAPGDGVTHSFNVVAGLDGAYAGDWLYHCHQNADAHMWGIFRVYSDTMDVEGAVDDLTVTVTDPEGRPVEDAVLTARWNRDAPLDPTLDEAADGVPVAADVDEVSPGVYRVQVDVPLTEQGELVIESSHEDGHTLARLQVQPGGSYTLNRDVGEGVAPGGGDPAVWPALSGASA